MKRPDAGLVILSDTSDEAANLAAITLGADEVLSRQDVIDAYVGATEVEAG